MPVGVEKIVKVAAVLQETKTCNIDLYLKGAIEGVVIKWATQINDVMIDTPTNAFNGGQNPLPAIGKRKLCDDYIIIAHKKKETWLISNQMVCSLPRFRNHILEQSTEKFHPNLQTTS